MRTSSLLKPVAIGLGGLMVAGLSFFSTGKKYTPRNTNSEVSGFAGAAEYYHWLKQDPATGKLNLAAMAEFSNAMVSRTNGNAKIASTALGLEWEELGPDNIGGRTRTVIVDKNNTNRLFCGTVSGGIYRSDNAGTNWYPINDQMATLIVSCGAQDGDGNLYFGTGEGMARGGGGDGNSAFIGAGLYRMDYNAATDSYAAPTLLPSTLPVPNQATGLTEWLYINRIGISPTKVGGNYILYAATNRGLQVSQDNGQTWTKGFSGTQTNNFVFDIDVCNDGTVYLTGGGGVSSASNKVYCSPAGNNGLPGTYVDITPPTSMVAWNNMGRIEIAASRTNSSIVYISVAKPLSTGAATLANVCQSVNGGTSWNILAVGTAAFEPFASYGQGDYDHVLEVFPDNDYSILLGGVDFYKWDAVNPATNPYTGQWDAFGDQFGMPTNLNYIHADKHSITFHPTDPDIIYFGTDGGVYKTTSRGYPFAAMNKGLNATQFYAIAFEREALSNSGANAGTFNGAGVFGGTQDNGTPYITGNFNGSKGAYSINGGDGFGCEASMLSKDVFFYSSYYGLLERTADRSGNGADFFPANRQLLCGSSTTPGTFGFAAFNTPIALWESGSVTNSANKVEFIVDSIRIPSVFLANGVSATYTFTIAKPQAAAVIDAPTIKIVAGNQVFTCNGTNILDNSLNNVGTYNASNDEVIMTFPTLPAANTPVKVTAAISYASSSLLAVTSASLNMNFAHTADSLYYTGDTIYITDPIQARLAFGMTNGVYVCTNPLNFAPGIQPTWLKVLGSTSKGSNGLNNPFSGTVTTLEFGGIDYLYVAVDNGSLWRIKNLSQLVDYNQDIAVYNPTLDSWTCGQNPNSPLVADRIALFGGSRTITSIAVDPTNPDRVAVTLGNYGTTSHVYYCGSATSVPAAANMSNFTQVSTLDNPAYSSTFIQTTYGETNPKNLLIGTEVGVYSFNLDSISSGSWVSEGNSPNKMFPNVPTFMLKQQTLGNWECYNSGIIYAGTHGRGIWASKNYYSPLVVGMNDPQNGVKATASKAIKVFPNPANDNTTVNFTLADDRKITISVYDLKGGKVKTVNCGRLTKGTQNFNISLDGMPQGTYIVAVSDEKDVLGTCRLVRMD